jgi:hypothetical protein
MDAQTKLLAGVDTKDLAIGIQINGQVGPNRTIVLTLGVPMAMTLPDLNGFMDKCMSVIDRQNDMGILQQLQLQLEGAEKDLATQRSHRADYFADCARKWEESSRKGEFQTTQAQKAQLDNFDRSANEIAQNRIPKLRKEIAEFQRRLDGSNRND